ncbi:PAS domain S-box protein [Methanoregula sp.]|uniref:PAS domain S-box protein n=1 Tax=Methanoregula sp. TaxID=2052170 RepID=UPI002373EE8A|nr:PAS domain S-box protein [Methanoregula sp.]MDD1686782.1 PAS domain S-box protein [Methanoregula sp.]
MYSVLYVDDEPALLDLGRIFLGMSGHISVDTALSAKEGIEKIHRHPYDAIISDYQMSGIDGIQFLQYIRKYFRELPFILFTGRGREEIVIEALNNGADFYLQKGGEPKSQFTELEYKIRTAIEQRHVHEELKTSRKQYSDLINFLPDATFAIDLKGKVILWNRMMEEMTGVPPQSVIGTGDQSYSIPFHGDRRLALADCIIRTGEDVEKVYPDLKRSGNRLTAEMSTPQQPDRNGAHYLLTASPIFDASGNVVGAIESVRDITQRREAEEKLRRAHEELNAAYEQLTVTEEELRQNYDELAKNQQALIQSEERYRAVVEDQTEFICRFSPDGTLTFVNDAYCRYFGLDRQTCIGKPHTATLPDEDRPVMKHHLSHISPKNPVAAIDHRILMPSGEIRWQHWSDRAIFDTSGRIIEFQSVGRDITDRKTTEEKLQRAYENLNAAYEQLTATEEELRQNYDELGKSQMELHSSYEQLTATEEELRQNYDELAKNQQALIRSEERYRAVVEDQTEFICRFSPDGTLTFVNDAYCRYFGLDRQTCIGRPHTVVLPQEDARLMKEQLARFSPKNPVAAIDHRIVMPSGEIRWQHWSDRAIFNTSGRIIEFQSVGWDITELKRIKEVLQESNKKLNLLSSITRHDILNQLTVLQGSLGLLEVEIADPENRQLLNKAIHASSVIQNQIAFTQQYQDIGVKKPRWQNLHAAVMTVCMDHGFSCVSLEHGLEACEIFADPLLRMVFLNLFENAAMHGGNVTRVQVSGEEIPDGYVVSVEDDGDGIPQEDKERIFLKGVGKHTGLGLFLAQEVLGITGLSIRETGEPGKGARFEIHVPKGNYRITPVARHS